VAEKRLHVCYVCLVNPDLLAAWSASSASEDNQWGFLGIWEILLEKDLIGTDNASLIVNESFRRLLESRYGRDRFPNISKTRIVTLPDVHFYDLWLEMDAEKQARLARVLDAEALDPDVVITHDPLPGAGQVFPRATVVGIEVGVYSRPPFHRTFFLDPFSFDCSGLVPRFIAEYEKGNLSCPDHISDVTASLPDFHVLLPEGVKPYLAHLRKKFGRILIHALQYPSPRYTPYTRHDNIGSFVRDYMKSIPAGTVVILCPRVHNYHLDPDEERQLRELAERYENLEVFPTELTSPYYTQLLVPYTDGVIAVTSTVGLQAAVLGKAWYTAPESFYSALTPTYEQIGDRDTWAPPALLRAYVSWMLRFFWVRRDVFYADGFVEAYLRACLSGGERTLAAIQRLYEQEPEYCFFDGEVVDREVYEKFSVRGGVPLVKGPFC
jgi:hypothetical protein